MTAREIRQTFLNFFQSKAHEIVPSAPMVIKDDPTLMFTNAGMNQFKDVFLGNVPRAAARIADAQKCLRVSGKHNDLEEVGRDTYHHTMFEMLGNWSFGDFFKPEAIAWAWELLTEVYGLDSDRLYVTYFEGDEGDGLEEDADAYKEWLKWTDASRILRGSKKDNFWEMGDTGPCGPCSEIHIDLRSDEERAQTSGADWVNKDHPQVVEVWNLVFMEFNRLASGKLVALPAKHVDTGMGFERLCMALQGVQSNYDTDVFQPLISEIASQSQVKYGADEPTDIALRVVADHVRAVSFAIADGQLPSNTGAGYVIRRILRRAIRYGFTYLNQKEPFIYGLVSVLRTEMGDAYPELVHQHTLIEKVIREEESAFLRTIEQGIRKLDEHLDAHPSVSGEKAFELYDTYGFPIDLTSLIVQEQGKTVDIAGFEQELEKQKERSRSATAMDSGDWVDWSAAGTEESVAFVGYDTLISAPKPLRYRTVKTAKKSFYQVVFTPTPFYPEGGGQVGDVGIVSDGQADHVVFNTKRENNLIVHYMESLPNPEGSWEARVDAQKRSASALNHSATHLLHFALREVLGEHVEQKGSYVGPDYLRFDFAHFSKLSSEELEAVEERVNALIRENSPLDEFRDLPIDEAMERGAMALFGEKYGDRVRMIQFGESRELCGGTHVSATGHLGWFQITSESAVAAGVRRIEAVTGALAEGYVREKKRTLEQLESALKNPNDPLKALDQLQRELSDARKKIEAYEKKAQLQMVADLKNRVQTRGGVPVIHGVVQADAGALKSMVFALLKELGEGVVLLGSEHDGKAFLAFGIAQQLVEEKGWNAGSWIKIAASHIRGGGGGQPHFATAGGTHPAGINEALNTVLASIQ